MKSISKVLPESFLKCMKSEDRKALGQMSAGEAVTAFTDTSERELQKLIYAELTRREIPFVWSRMNRPARAFKGQPDFICCIGGHFTCFECKTATGTLSEEQKRYREAVVRNGGLFYTVRSLDEVVSALKEIQ